MMLTHIYSSKHPGNPQRSNSSLQRANKVQFVSRGYSIGSKAQPINRLRTALLLGILLIATTAAAQISTHGYVRHYSGWLADDGSTAIQQNTLNLNLSSTDGNFAWRAVPYIYQYNNGDSLNLDLRQLYMDYYGSFYDLRIGRQQIIWGKADGVFITDIISPKDLGEFLLRDFEEIRQGLTAAKLSLYRGANQLDMVWVPTFSATKYPADGSLWEPIKPLPVEPIIDHSGENIPSTLENSEAFMRLAHMGSFMDWELMAGYAWDDDPDYSIQSLVMTATGPQLTLQGEQQRLNILGASFNKPIGGWLLRGEGAYYNGRQFMRELDITQVQTQLAQGLPLPELSLERDHLHYLLGLDMNILGIDLSTQFIQEYIMDYDESLQQDEFHNMMTILARETFFRETLSLELFSYIGLNNEDALLRPKASYDLGSGMALELGANVFLGDEGMFGQYDSNDMVYTRLRVDF